MSNALHFKTKLHFIISVGPSFVLIGQEEHSSLTVIDFMALADGIVIKKEFQV